MKFVPQLKTPMMNVVASSEPSGAMALAGIKKYVETHELIGQNIVSIVCGANMNFDRLRYIAERTELGERKEAIFAVTIPEKKRFIPKFLPSATRP